MNDSSDQTKTILGSPALALQVTRYRLNALIATPFARDFQKREVFIGSHPDCDFCIPDSSISRQHAKIEMDAGGYRLIDLGSKNGTFIGECRINDVYLPENICFRCGTVKIEFELGSDAIEVAISQQDHFGNMLGQSLAMREIFGLLAKVSPSTATVLVEGESGSGKELVAEAICAHSERAQKPFVIFDCSAVSKDLIESELFGHVKGSFTGAVSDRKGAFLQANGGTLFLDEIGELALDLQPKLLRALENHTIRPVGSEKSYKVDVRVIAATNRSLAREVENGSFREDLYYRLAVIKIDIPPLRKRTEDIPLLVEHFIQEASKKFRKNPPHISLSTLQKLKAYSWPGNVRELKNFIERACLLSSNDRLETKFLNVKPQDNAVSGEPGDTDAYVEMVLERQMPFKEAKQNIIEQFESLYWKKLLESTKGNVSKAARLADMHRKSVEYIVRKLNLNIRNTSAKDDETEDFDE